MKKREEKIPMSILEQIRADSVSARKSNDKLKSGLLVTLLSEAQTVGKNAGRETTDEETIAVIKKFIKNSNQVAEAARDNITAETNAYKEIEILESYLPKQLTEDEIIEIIKNIKTDANTMETKFTIGLAQTYFKLHYAGRYDGALVAKYAK